MAQYANAIVHVQFSSGPDSGTRVTPHLLKAVDDDPGDFLWYMQTDAGIEAHVKQRIDPMIALHEPMKAKLGRRAVDNSIHFKRFGGMTAQFLSATESNLINKSAPRIVADEVDAYAEGLGDVKALLDVRRQTFGRRSKLLALSHPDLARGLDPGRDLLWTHLGISALSYSELTSEGAQRAAFTAESRQAFERAAALRDKAERLAWLRERLTRFRASMDRLTFRYFADGAAGGRHVYLLRRGTVRAQRPAPMTPEDHAALERLAQRIYRQADPAGGDVPVHDLEELYVVESWFRRHPEELAKTAPGVPDAERA